jgi:hypothetical protein
LMTALMHVGWRIGLVRLALPRLEPGWVRTLPSLTRGQFRAVFSRANPGWGDALDAYDRTPAAERPSSEAGSLGESRLWCCAMGRAQPG